MPREAGGLRTDTRRMHKLRTEFFLEGKRLDADPKTRDQANCWICHGRIDYDADPGSTDDSHNLDHFKSVRDFPDLQEDPTGFRHAHRSCNIAHGADAPVMGLGEQMPEWW